jgi:hypothetical protein
LLPFPARKLARGGYPQNLEGPGRRSLRAIRFIRLAVFLTPPTLRDNSRGVIAADPLLTHRPAVNADYGDFPSAIG